MTAVLKSKQDKVLKELRAVPANKRCFDCGVGIPTYANMTVSTLVCQSCAGVLRELQHRVKGLTMATFTKEELSALTHGGNEQAMRVWRRNNAPETHLPPNASAAQIKRHMENTYVAKKWFNAQGAANVTPVAAAKPKAAAAAAQADADEDDTDDGDEDDDGDDDDAPGHSAPAPAPSKAQKTAPAAAAAAPAVRKPQQDLLGDLLSFDDVKTVSHDPFAAPPPAAPAASLMGFDFGGSPFASAPQASPFGAAPQQPNPFAAPAPAAVANPFATPAPAAVNPFAAAPPPAAVNPFAVQPAAPAATVNPFLAQLGMSTPAPQPVNPFAPTPAAAAVPPKQQPFNPFLDPAPPSHTASSDALLAQKLQQEEVAAAKQRAIKQEEADRQLAMRLAQGNDLF
jgi:hypothetical protein